MKNMIIRGYHAMEKFHWALLGIAVLGLALRLIWVGLTAKIGFGDLPTDQALYVERGYDIANFVFPRNLYQPPLYLYFLGGIIKTLEVLHLDTLLPLRGVVGGIQALLAAGSIFALGLLGKRRISPAAGLIGAFVLAIWPNQVIAAGNLLTERITTPLVVFGLAFLLWDEKQPRKWLLLSAGLMLGLAVLARSSLLLLLPFAAFVAFITVAGWRSRFAKAALVTVGASVVLVPWLGYAYWVTGEPSVLTTAGSTAGGFNLCLGNNDIADGFWQDEIVERYCPWPHGTGADQVHASNELQSTALAWMRDNPGEQPRLVQQRFKLMFRYDNDSTGWYPTYKTWEVDLVSRETLHRYMNRWWENIVAFCVLGLLAMKRRLRWQLLVVGAVIALIPMLSVGDMRYKDPLIPLLALGFGALMAWIIEHLVRSWKSYSYEGRTEVFVLQEKEGAKTP